MEPLDPLVRNLHSSLKIVRCREYLEAGLSGSMRNSNLIHSDLSASVPSTFSLSFTLETKGKGGESGRVLAQRRKKIIKKLKDFFVAIDQIDLAQQKCDHIVYAERTITIYGCDLF
jgi:pantothenate synthetase